MTTFEQKNAFLYYIMKVFLICYPNKEAINRDEICIG